MSVPLALAFWLAIGGSPSSCIGVSQSRVASSVLDTPKSKLKSLSAEEAAIAGAAAAEDPCGRYNAYTATPTRAQTAR